MFQLTDAEILGLPVLLRRSGGSLYPPEFPRGPCWTTVTWTLGTRLRLEQSPQPPSTSLNRPSTSFPGSTPLSRWRLGAEKLHNLCKILHESTVVVPRLDYQPLFGKMSPRSSSRTRGGTNTGLERERRNRAWVVPKS